MTPSVTARWSSTRIRELGLALALGGCSGTEPASVAPRGEQSSPEATAPPSSDVGPARYVQARRYAPGSVLRYRLSRSYFQDGALERTEHAVSVHTVLPGSPPRESIAFESLITTRGGEQLDLTEEMGRFPPYEVSLAASAPEGSLDAPRLEGWSMDVVGVITDLHTFLVATSPQVGVEQANALGEPYVVPKPVVGSWANGTDVLVGQDCIQITVTLTELREHTAVFETRFLPPSDHCLEPLTPRMSEPVVAGTPNNFQQKARMGEQLGAMWGNERFVVVSEVRRSDGALLEASMSNELQLRMLIACTEDLDSCQHEVPLHLRRELTMTLIDERMG